MFKRRTTGHYVQFSFRGLIALAGIRVLGLGRISCAKCLIILEILNRSFLVCKGER